MKALSIISIFMSLIGIVFGVSIIVAGSALSGMSVYSSSRSSADGMMITLIAGGLLLFSQVFLFIFSILAASKFFKRNVTQQ